jgi:hypothetical protein
MAPPLPATLVLFAVFSTSSRARRQRSPGRGTTAREHCGLASCKAVFVVLPLSWWRSQRPGRRVTTPAGPPLVAYGIPMFLGRSAAVTAVNRVLSAAAPARPSGRSPRSPWRHSSNSHSARAAARGLAQSGYYEIAFGILAATVVPSDLVETSGLSRREAPAATNPKKLRECDPAHTCLGGGPHI